MHGKKLGIEQAFLYRLVPVVGEIMVSYYPEVLQQKEFIEKVIRTEEERFNETINEGLEILNQVIQEVKNENGTTLAGKDIFKLYDTYGFPVELTEEVAEDEGLKVDHAGFEKKWMHNANVLALPAVLKNQWGTICFIDRYQSRK